ncbi:MAG: ABC transporter ATP-binding protein [Gammaproteobacteria bacterium]
MPAEPLLDIHDLRKRFAAPGAGWRGRGEVSALDGVSFTLGVGEALGLVGESGSGKSTLALALAGLEQLDSGTLRFAGEDITRMRRGKALRRQIQLIFQDPYQAFHPLHRIGAQIAEPLQVHGIGRDRRERWVLAQAALEEVGLRPAGAFDERYPHELSGGQLQRAAIAAALVLQPRLLIADEPVAMLDAASRQDVLGVLNALRVRHGVALLLISHDIAMTAWVVDRLAVMRHGRIVEIGPVDAIVHRPAQAYTQALLAAVPGARWRQEVAATLARIVAIA